MVQKKQTKKSGISTGKVIAIGAGVAALGAGAYYLLGPDGKKNQKKATDWMLKMKKEAEQKVKKVKKATEPVYHSVVDTLAANYSKQYKEHSGDIKAFATELKKNWNKTEKKVKPILNKTKKNIEKKIKLVKKPLKK
jgi:gas vesicle protein